MPPLAAPPVTPQAGWLVCHHHYGRLRHHVEKCIDPRSRRYVAAIFGTVPHIVLGYKTGVLNDPLGQFTV